MNSRRSSQRATENKNTRYSKGSTSSYRVSIQRGSHTHHQSSRSNALRFSGISVTIPKYSDAVRHVSKVRTLQNTYRLESQKPFSQEIVNKILKRIIEPELEEVEYNEKVIPELCLLLAEAIRNAVKEENFDRYRIIVAVTMGQKRQQSVNISHSFLWDHERDRFAAFNTENGHIFLSAVVYGIYLD